MCRGFRSVNIVLTLYFESLETLDFTVFYSYVNGSNPLTHANNLDRKSLVLEGFRFFVVKKLLLTFVDIF